MAYTPTEWATGDVITAEKLNKAEGGIEANSKAIYTVFIELQEGQPVILDGVLAAALEAFDAGKVVMISFDFGEYKKAYYAVDNYEGSLHLVNAEASAGTLRLNGIEWSESGLAQWPSLS